MKLQVTQENLNKALTTVARVANSRNPLPILNNILLKTVDNRLSVAATNLDIATTHFIGSKISTGGAITVPARLMQDFIGSLPESVLDLELEDNKLHITTEKYRSTINGTSAEEFPVMPKISDGKKWVLPAKNFKKALSQVVFAASSDDARPILTGVSIHTHGGYLYIAATDSYRLAQKKLTKQSTETGLLVPATATQDLLRIITDQDDEVSITHDDQQAQFMVGDVTLVTRLIEGNYPDYRKLIPKSFATTAQVKLADFLNITKVSSLFARESAGSITIKVEKDMISINSVASQLGENTAQATAAVTGGGEVTLNSRYLIDALGAFSAEEVKFCFNGKLEPCVLKSEADSDYIHIVMPLRS